MSNHLIVNSDLSKLSDFIKSDAIPKSFSNWRFLAPKGAEKDLMRVIYFVCRGIGQNNKNKPELFSLKDFPNNMPMDQSSLVWAFKNTRRESEIVYDIETVFVKFGGNVIEIPIVNLDMSVPIINNGNIVRKARILIVTETTVIETEFNNSEGENRTSKYTRFSWNVVTEEPFHMYTISRILNKLNWKIDVTGGI